MGLANKSITHPKYTRAGLSSQIVKKHVTVSEHFAKRNKANKTVYLGGSVTHHGRGEILWRDRHQDTDNKCSFG